MKTKIKKISKSTVSLLLTLMMLFSCVTVGNAVSVEVEDTFQTTALSEEHKKDETENNTLQKEVTKSLDYEKNFPEKSGTDTYTFYFDKYGISNWTGSDVYMHAYTGGTIHTGSWKSSASKMTQNSSTGLYTLSLSVIPQNIIFHDGNGHKLSPFPFSGQSIEAGVVFTSKGNLGYLPEQWVSLRDNTAVSNSDLTIYYKNTNNWDAVSCYGWGTFGSTKLCETAWPGQLMTCVDATNKIYSVTLNRPYNNIIFNNNNNGSQIDTIYPSYSYDSNGKLVLANNYYDGTQWTTYSTNTFNVTLATVSDGIIATVSGVDNGKASEGSTVKFTATSTNTTNYYTSSVTVTKAGGGTVEATPTANTNEYSFTMPADNVTISATFTQKQTYNITAAVANDSIGYGNVSPTNTTARTGESVTITATPEDGYKFTGWTITGSYSFVSGSSLSSSAVTIYPTSDVTLTANFGSVSVTRIYFHDKINMGLPQVYFWENGSSTNQNEWPGYDSVMTPVDGYINLYYIDIDTSVYQNINRLIFNNMYKEPDQKNDMGSQTKDFELASGKTLEDYNGKVFTVGTTPDSNSSYQYPATVPSLGNTAYDFNTYVANSSNGVKAVGDSGYRRVYFYDKINAFATNRAYVQYGTADNDFVPLSYSNVRARSTSSNTIDKYFPGKKMVPVTDNPNYNQGNLYYADVPYVSGNTYRVVFNDGHKWACEPNQKHITKSIQLPSEGNNCIVLDGTNQANGQGSYTYTKNGQSYPVQLLSSIDTKPYLTITQTHSDLTDGTINIWAKRGTTRDGEQNRNDGTYSNYITNGNTTISYVDGTTLNISETGFNGHVNTYNAKKGKTIRITTTINAANKNKYYVKAFCINGFSYSIIGEPAADDTRRTSGVYTYDYKIPEDMSETDLEITPIFFYLTDSASDNNGNSFITFKVEDFMNCASIDWGNTLSCYAWYDEGSKGYDKADGKRPALGGYPGQPMVYENGSHYIQIPKYVYYDENDNNGVQPHEIQGITLSNYYWDDVHFYKGYLGAKGNNCQTYDYDDFVALLNYIDPEMESIIFSFKYRTMNESSGGNTVDTQNKNRAYLYNKPSKVGNGWDPLVNYYNTSVDLFGFKTRKDANTYYSEDEIKAMIADNKASYKTNGTLPNKFIYIVSNGYEEGESDYIGYYATKWYIYDEDGKYLGALPPSAFEWNIPDAYIDSDLPAEPLEGFLHYSDKAFAHNNGSGKTRQDLWNTYISIYNAGTTSNASTAANPAVSGSAEKNYTYRNMPAVITYETSVGSKGSQGNYGIRCDGRWYYSRSSETIHASTMIQIVDSEGNIISANDTFITDGNGGYKGTLTQAHAYFTNTEFKNQIESGEVFQDSSKSFTFEADGVVRGTDGKKYTFVGWYLNRGADVYTPVNAESDLYNNTGSRAMSSNAVFVARYTEVETSDEEITIAHMPYSQADRTLTGSPALGNGTGKTSVKVRVLDSNGDELSVIDKTSSAAKVTLAKLLQAGAAYLEVTLYNTDNDPISELYRYTGTENAPYPTIYNVDDNAKYDTDSRNSGDAGTINDLTNGAPETLKYVYDISSFLLDGETINNDKKEIYYYTNYDKGRQLTVTHELLKAIVDNREQGVTEQAALDSIVGKNFNKITPHEDMFVDTSVTPNTPTTTKVTISVSADGTNYNAVQNAVNVDTATLKPSDLSGKSYVKITLTTTPGTGTFDKNDYYFKGKYYTGSDMYYNPTEASSTETTYLYNTNALQQPTTGLTTCEFIVPVANIFDNVSSKFVTEYLRFYSDPQKTIDIVVKYYDREVISNEPAHISQEATTINLKYGVAPYGKENTYSNFKNDNTGILNKFNDVDNILDEYDFWLEQSQALESIKSKKFYYYAKDKTVENVKNYTYNDYFTNKTNFAEYFNVEVGQIDSNSNVDDVLKYHTDYNGMPNTSNEKWVTYKDSSGTEISDEKQATTTLWTNVKTIVIWGYNAPKRYEFTAYFTPSQVDNNGEKIPLIYQDGNDGFEMTDVDKSVLYDNDDNNNKNGTHQVLIDKNDEYGVIKGFFNQRLGKVTSTTNDTSGYLGSYGITTPYFGDPGGVIGNGYDITADQTATYKDENGTPTSYVFDGWYIKDKYGYHKYSNETTYDERVVCDLSIYAGYVKVEIDNEVDNTYHDKIGVSVTWNGIDHYVDEQQNEMVRVNTELCVYGTEIKDNDDQIVDIASIYFNVPTQGTITGTTYNADINWKDPRNKQALIEEFNNADNRNALRAQIKTHIDRLESYYSTHENIGCYHSSNIYDITVEIEDIELNHGVIDYYTYRVQDSIDYNTAHTDKTAKSFKLTNKNRIQFVMPITKEKYEATPFLAFVAMRCKDKDENGNFTVAPNETYTWYVSDNFVSNFGVEDLPSTEYPPKPDPDDNTPEDFITPIEAGSDKSDINVSESIQDYNDSKEETNDTIQKYDVSSEEINDTKQQIDDTYDALLDNKDIVVTEF